MMATKKIHILFRDYEHFLDRRDAGRQLADQIKKHCAGPAVVLGIPRGGLVIADEIARALGAQLDIVLAHKLGAPGNPELAIGSIDENGRTFLNTSLADRLPIDPEYIESEKARQLITLKEHAESFRAVHPKVELSGKTVIVTDDGIATGATMRAALWCLRQERPKSIVAALPVGAQESLESLSRDADEIICLRVPPLLSAIGQFYIQFDQVTDREVIEILKKHAPQSQ